MEENETIVEYDRRMRDIANEAFSLGDPMSNERLVSKVLRSLPEHFNIKICAIDESKDTSTLNLEDLISSLKTFEMNLDLQKRNTGKAVALQTTDGSVNSLIQEAKDSDLGQSFGVAAGVTTPGRNTMSKSLCLNAKSMENPEVEEIQEFDQEELTIEIVQMMYEELYGYWLKRNKTNTMLSKENTDLKNSLSRLEVLLRKKDLKLCKVKDDLEKASKTLAKFNSSSSKLDAMLTMGKDGRTGLGYVESIYEHGESSNAGSKNTLFVKGVEDCSIHSILNPPMKNVPMLEMTTEQKLKTPSSVFSPSKVLHSSKKPQVKKTVPTSQPKQRKCHFICHYCHKAGHIKPFCYKLRDDYLNWQSNRVLHNTKHNTSVKKSTTRKIWVSKTVIRCNVVYTSLKTNIVGAWYFDSGCSRHMIGSKEHVTDYVEVKTGRVTYGGGAKGRIVGKGTLNVDGLPELYNVLHVLGLLTTAIWWEKVISAEVPSFIREKSDTFDVFKKLHARITNLHDVRVIEIWTDHGKEFENSLFTSLCEKKGISHEFFAPKTPQQNGIAERKNQTLQEMARVMLSSKNVSKRFWAEALNTACHISNRMFLRSGSTMTSYEIIMGRKTNLKYFHVFGCVRHVLNDREHLAKFDSKSDKCLFIGYSMNSRAYRVFNLRTRTTIESINVVFDDLAGLTGKTKEDATEGLLEIGE
ncbi:uncharacterized protein LOC142541961 [Primulina tabacum]|uniref:uncharacterized protein LOC142541961 n=1 Tax=Primulina tabacum TaxID=48773 RepID=UPI003F59BE48